MANASELGRLGDLLDLYGKELGAIDGIVGYGLGLSVDSTPIIQIFASKDLDESDVRRLSGWFGDRFQVTRTGPAEAQ